MDIKAFFDDLKKRFMKSSAKGPADPNDDGLGQYDEAGAFPTDKENEAQNAEPMASDDGPANTKQTLVAKANGAINQIKQTTRDLLQRFLKKKDQADVAGDVGEDHAEDTAQDVGPEGAGGITEDPTEADVGEGPEDETDKTDKTEEATVDQGAARDEDDKVSAPGVGEGEGPPPDQATSDTASDAGEISAEADTVVDQDAAGETEESTKTLIDKTKAVLAQVKNSRKHQIILIAGAIIFMAIINFPEEEEGEVPEEGVETSVVENGEPSPDNPPVDNPPVDNPPVDNPPVENPPPEQNVSNGGDEGNVTAPESVITPEPTVTPETEVNPTPQENLSPPPVEEIRTEENPAEESRPLEEGKAEEINADLQAVTPLAAEENLDNDASAAEASSSNESEVQAGGEEGEGKTLLTDAILQMKEKLQEETPPEDPLYEISGRGLVYNCVGQHWACVDREVYFKCQELKHWSEEHQQPLRCYPANVYISESDCVTMQVYNINKLIRPEQCPRH